MATLAQYVTRLSEDYIRDPSYRIWKQTAQERAINKGYTQVQADLSRTAGDNENNATTTTTAGTMQYALPSDCLRVSLVRYNGDDLIKTTRKELKEQYESFQTGTPTHYYVYAGLLGLHPYPDTSGTTIDLEYYKKLSTLTSVQSSELPDDFDDAILLYAAYKLFLGVHKNDQAMMYLQDYQSEINKLRSVYWYDDENSIYSIDKVKLVDSAKSLSYSE